MRFQRLVKIITKNMALLSIILAFVLGVVGMTGLRSKFFDTSKWFMSEEEVHEKFGDDDDKKVQDEQHQTDENGNLITPEQGQSDNTNDSDVSDASGKAAVSDSDASTEVNNSSETVLLSETENTNLSVISQTSQDGESESSSQFAETDKEMTSSTKITSATTKEQKETKASSTSRATETEAPSDTTTTTVATTEETTNTTAPLPPRRAIMAHGSSLRASEGFKFQVSGCRGESNELQRNRWFGGAGCGVCRGSV